MNRIRFLGMGIVLTLATLACSLGAPAAPASPDSDQSPISLSPETESPTGITAQPSETPSQPSAVSAAPLAIHPEHAGQIELLASPETNPFGRIYHAIWQPGTENLLIESTNSLFLLDLEHDEILWNNPSSYQQSFFTPDGSELLAIGSGELFRLDPATGGTRSSQTFSMPDGIFALSPDGQFLASTLGGDITLLDLQTDQVLNLPADLNSGPIYDLAFSADGQWILAGSQDGSIQLWDAHSGQSTFFSPATIPSEVYECRPSGVLDGQSVGVLVMECSYPLGDGAAYRVGVYPAGAKTPGNNLTIRDGKMRGYSNFVTNADRSLLATVVGEDVEIWSTTSGSMIRVLPGVAGSGLSFNPTTKTQLAVWTQQGITVWDVNSGQKESEWVIPGATEPVTALAFSPALGSRVLIIAHQNGIVERWSLNPLEKTAEWQGGDVTSLAFSADGNHLAIGQASGLISLFDMSAALVPQAELQAGFAVNALAFAPESPDLMYVAGKSHHIHLWDVDQQKEIAALTGSNLFELTTLSQSNNIIAAGTEPGRIVLWRDVPDSDPFTELAFSDVSPILSLQIRPNVNQVLFTQGNTLRVWNFQTKEQVRETFFRNEETVRLQSTPDGCTLAIQARNAVELLDASTFEPFSKLTSSSRFSSPPTFSSDGILLAAGTEDGGLLIWGMAGALESPNGTTPTTLCRSIPPLPTRTPAPTASATLRPSVTPAITATATPTPPTLARSLFLTDPLMRGDDVLLLQQRLIELGYTEVGMPDGVFGKMTDAAVRRFQQGNNLTVDGIVGSKTWEILFALASPD